MVTTERGRITTAVGVAVVPALALTFPLILADVVSGVVTSGVVAAIAIYGFTLIAYCALTVLAFTRAPAESAAPDSDGRGTPGTPVAVTFTVLSLSAALWLALAGDVSRLPVPAALTALLVASAWVTMLVTYAADYARRQALRADLAFPGEEPRGFHDYLYFSAGVCTTFGATDVTVTSPELRRVVMTHGIVAFVVNTVVVALLVSTLLSPG